MPAWKATWRFKLCSPTRCAQRASTISISISVTLAWLYARTDGSLLLTMLMHAAVNNTKDIVPSAVPGAHDAFAHLSLAQFVPEFFLVLRPLLVEQGADRLDQLGRLVQRHQQLKLHAQRHR